MFVRQGLMPLYVVKSQLEQVDQILLLLDKYRLDEITQMTADQRTFLDMANA